MQAAQMLAAATVEHVCDGPGGHGRKHAVDIHAETELRTSLSYQTEVQIVFSLD
jgi:hypothetical protein